MAANAMAERAKLRAPASKHGVTPKTLGIEDMLGTTGATDTQVRFVLRQIAQAVEPGVGRHLRAGAASAVRR